MTAMRIGILEEPAVSEVLLHGLLLAGHVVSLFPTVESVLAVLAQRRDLSLGLDLLILDGERVAGEGSSARKLLAQLRRRDLALPILLLVFWGPVLPGVDLQDLPHIHIIEKPFTVQELFTALQDMESSSPRGM